MKTLALALAVVVAAAGFSVPQDPPAFQPPKPGKHHEHLKAQEGTWEFTSTFQMAPGAPEETVKGVQTNTLCGGGLWLVIDSKGGDFWGHGVVGYDEQRKKYVSSWVDNMSDYVQVGEGDCSDDGKVQTTQVRVKSMADPTKWETMKEVFTVVDKDTSRLEFFATGPDGKEFRMGKIEYKRKK